MEHLIISGSTLTLLKEWLGTTVLDEVNAQKMAQDLDWFFF